MNGIVSTLRRLPVWLFAGLAVAGLALLFLPLPYADQVRANWGGGILTLTVASGCLAVARSIDAARRLIALGMERARRARPLRFVAAGRSWWHLARQRNGTILTQLRIELVVSNVGEATRQIVSVKLARPRIPGASGELLLPDQGTNFHSTRAPIPGFTAMQGSVNVMVPRELGRAGHAFGVTLMLVDNLGVQYRVRFPELHYQGSPPPPPLLASARDKLLSIMRPAPPLPSVWAHDGSFDAIDSVLQEELRNYAARDRGRGLLGSLNVGVQSRPDRGTTHAGDVPRLLWPKGDGLVLGSPNLDKLLAAVRKSGRNGAEGAANYLLSHLDRRSRFAGVAYLNILGLHRLGRLGAALTAARANLAGDQNYGYSNAIAVVSALVSHEHGDLPDELLTEITQVLHGDEEHDFQLREKINLVRVERIDHRPRRSRKTPNATTPGVDEKQ